MGTFESAGDDSVGRREGGGERERGREGGRAERAAEKGVREKGGRDGSRKNVRKNRSGGCPDSDTDRVLCSRNAQLT